MAAVPVWQIVVAVAVALVVLILVLLLCWYLGCFKRKKPQKGDMAGDDFATAEEMENFN